MAYLDHKNKSDKKILKFCKDMGSANKIPTFYVSELGNYDHCADEYQLLIVGCSRELVKSIRALVVEVQKIKTKKRKGNG